MISLKQPRSFHPFFAMRPDARQHGIALVTAMLILVVLTLLAVAMFRGFALQQKIAGNTREKERAFEAAQNALQYSEWWLSQMTRGTGIVCNSTVVITTANDMRVCSSPLPAGIEPSNWAGASTYTPPAMTVSNGGGVASDGNGNLDINYVKAPSIYIAYLGLGPNKRDVLYSVTAAGYGGSGSSAAIVQSVFRYTAKVRNLDVP